MSPDRKKYISQKQITSLKSGCADLNIKIKYPKLFYFLRKKALFGLAVTLNIISLQKAQMRTISTRKEPREPKQRWRWGGGSYQCLFVLASDWQAHCCENDFHNIDRPPLLSLLFIFPRDSVNSLLHLHLVVISVILLLSGTEQDGSDKCPS